MIRRYWDADKNDKTDWGIVTSVLILVAITTSLLMALLTLI